MGRSTQHDPYGECAGLWQLESCWGRGQMPYDNPNFDCDVAQNCPLVATGCDGACTPDPRDNVCVIQYTGYHSPEVCVFVLFRVLCVVWCTSSVLHHVLSDGRVSPQHVHCIIHINIFQCCSQPGCGCNPDCGNKCADDPQPFGGHPADPLCKFTAGCGDTPGLKCRTTCMVASGATGAGAGAEYQKTAGLRGFV